MRRIDQRLILLFALSSEELIQLVNDGEDREIGADGCSAGNDDGWSVEL